jgi:ATP-dependent RNA helicase DBP3
MIPKAMLVRFATLVFLYVSFWRIPAEVSPKKRKRGVDDEQKEKKKKKKSKESEPSTEDTTPVGDDDATIETKTKKKKKKSKTSEVAQDDKDEEMIVDETSTSDKRKKKSKYKAVDVGEAISTEPIASTSTSTVATAAPSEAEVSAFLTQHSITINVPDRTAPVSPAIAFSHVSVPRELQSAFSDFAAPTPIQACAWPPALAGRDVVGIAETGSGKTLAFGIPALARLLASGSRKSKKKGKDVVTKADVLVVAPTRELALQTHDTLSAIGNPLGIGSVAVFGGVDKKDQVRLLRGGSVDGVTTRIIVGTPGRILDLVNEGACDLSGVSYLVLDEADRMLDKGFENDIRKIIGFTIQGEGRQTLMCKLC